MYITEKTLDDLMYKVLGKLINRPFDVTTTKGKSSEIMGALLYLKNPRARLSRTETKGKAFSAIGELLWYLSGDNKLDFITYYLPLYKKFSDDQLTIYGGYGPRLYNLRGSYNQIQNVIDLLGRKQSTRQAVIQLFDGEDIVNTHKDIPCTCTLQFLIRNNKLHLYTTMRSNDAFIGLPHDIFAFTMLQELIAKTLDVKLGHYKHFVASLHLYEDSKDKAKAYINEGLQATTEVMPKMPKGNPWEWVSTVQKAEEKIRLSKPLDMAMFNGLPNYWKDMATLLQIHALLKRKKSNAEINVLKENLFYKGYKTFVDDKLVSR